MNRLAKVQRRGMYTEIIMFSILTVSKENLPPKIVQQESKRQFSTLFQMLMRNVFAINEMCK